MNQVHCYHKPMSSHQELPNDAYACLLDRLIVDSLAQDRTLFRFPPTISAVRGTGTSLR